MQILIDKILPNPEQPRQEFDQNALKDLAASIKKHGVILPIAVEEAEDGQYILHDGERRLRAAKLARLKTIPAHVVPALNGSGPQERLERAIVANIQRMDMNPIEEAMGFSRLMKEFGLTTRQVAERIGRKGSNGHRHVLDRLILLKLDEPIRDLIARGKFSRSANVARALLRIPDSETRISLAKKLSKCRSSNRSCIASANKLADMMASQDIDTDGAPPAVSIAITRAGRKPKKERWNALVQIGKMPSWQSVTEKTKQTCKRCDLYDIANSKLCGNCPLVNFLHDLMDEVH